MARLGALGDWRRLVRIALGTRRLGSLRWARMLDEARVQAWEPLSVEDGLLVSPGLGISVRLEDARTLLPAFVPLRRLRADAGAVLRRAEGGWQVEVGGVRFVVRNPADAYAAAEVFCDRVYDIALQGPFQVVDVGLNVGLAALRLASRPEVRSVVGYELFPSNAAEASANLALNPALTGKVRVVAAGLADREGDHELEFSAEAKGVTGLDGPLLALAPSPRRRVRVRVLDAAAEVRRAAEEGGGAPLVLKLDCEGGEHRIIPRLVDSGAIDHVHAVMLELHGLEGGTATRPDLAHLLRRAGFDLIHLRGGQPGTSMVYAFRARAA